MHINNLPSLVFRLIFSRLSLHDQLQVGRVCWLWKEYQRDVTTKVRWLTLLVGVEDHDGVLHLTHYYSNPLHKNYRSPSDQIAQSPFTLPHCSELLNDRGDGPLYAAQPNSGLLNVEYLNSSNVNLLVKALPNVHTLNIAINDIGCHIMEHVICLVNQWKDKLVTLKLWCNFSHDPVDDCLQFTQSYRDIPPPITFTLAKLLESLNSLPTLDHLTLDFNHHFCPYNSSKTHFPEYNFSVLSRLREFNFRSLDFYTELPIYKWLKQCDVTDTRLQRIGLDFEIVTFEDDILSLPPALVSKITVLHQWYFKDSQLEELKEETQRYLNGCPSLTSLRFSHIEYLVELFNILALFKQLIHLELDFIETPSSVLSHFDRTPSHQIAQLPSVKLLTLKCEKHYNLNSRNWAWVFPNVQILCMEHNCFKPTGRLPFRFYEPCWNKDKWTAESMDQLVSDVRDWLATFKQMPKLRRIYLNDNEKEYKGQYDLVKINFTF